jgi:hypothetical protein
MVVGLTFRDPCRLGRARRRRWCRDSAGRRWPLLVLDIPGALVTVDESDDVRLGHSHFQVGQRAAARPFLNIYRSSASDLPNQTIEWRFLNLKPENDSEYFEVILQILIFLSEKLHKYSSCMV